MLTVEYLMREYSAGWMIHFVSYNLYILQVKCSEEVRPDRQTVTMRSKLLERVYSDKARPGDVDDMFPWSTTR